MVVKNPSICVEVAYASAHDQVIIPMTVPVTSTVYDAINQAGILQRFPEIDLNYNRIGIFSKPCSLEQVLKSGDRIEIYRPLLIDPKQARLNRP